MLFLFIDKTVVGSWSSCICFMEDGRDVSFGVQFRVKTCFSSCKNKKGCPSERVQNRTCACNSIPKTTVKPGLIIRISLHNNSVYEIRQSFSVLFAVMSR